MIDNQKHTIKIRFAIFHNSQQRISYYAMQK